MYKRFTFLLIAILTGVNLTLAASPKREFRATWFTTHYAIDWPTTYVTSTGNATQIAKQKQEMDAILDALVAGHMNAFCMQIRPTADAFYQSRFEPWSKNLSGTRGLDPGYDPLAYAVEQGHKRGLEVHVWVNPFRVTTSGTVETTDPVYIHCHDWLIKYDNGSFSGTIIDPGFPQARKYVIDVLMEAINNYDIDGILMDDYFYPYGGTTTEDATSKSLYKPAGMNDGDWRRHNVDTTMRMLYDSIQAVKPWVRFGMGPFGIWTTQKSVAQKYGISLPQGITGLDDYAVQYCNTVEWVKQGCVDYIAPQLYWPTTSTGQDYDVLCKWWSQDVCKHFSDLLPGNQRVDFFVSQAAYRYNTPEIVLEIDDNRAFDQLGGPGSIFYNTNTFIGDNGQGTVHMHLQLAQQRFASLALPPAMDWKPAPVLPAPTHLTLQGTTLSWSSPAYRFTVYSYPPSVPDSVAIEDSRYLVGICYDTCMSVAMLPYYNNYAYAVRAYDRYGNEYAPAVYRDVQPITCNPYGYESMADMFGDWTLDYNDIYDAQIEWEDYDDYLAKENPAKSIAAATFETGLMYALMQTPKWQWLATYVDSVNAAAVLAGAEYSSGKTVTALGTDDRSWRFAMAAFWTHMQYTSWPGSADFTTAGLYPAFQPAWGWTWCEAPAQLSDIKAPSSDTRILLHHGQILIIRDNKVYTPLGIPMGI